MTGEYTLTGDRVITYRCTGRFARSFARSEGTSQTRVARRVEVPSFRQKPRAVYLAGMTCPGSCLGSFHARAVPGPESPGAVVIGSRAA